MEYLIIVVVVAVSFMASAFVFGQVRQLWHAARIGWQTKNYTMFFWSALAIVTLLSAMTIFFLSMYDIVDGRFDILFKGNGNHIGE